MPEAQEIDRAKLFLTTQWSMVHSAKFGDPRDATDALHNLCEIYWPPVYAFLRRRGYSQHDAEDLNQGFFCHLIEGNFLRYVQREHGRFRTFLLSSLNNYITNEWHRAHAAKRGGKESLPVSFDSMTQHDLESIEPSETLTPEQAFDRRWALTVLQRAISRLREIARTAGKEDLFVELQPYLTGSVEEGYGKAAAKLGISETGLKVMVHRLRKHYGEIVRQEIRETLQDPSELDKEIRDLISLVT